MFEKIIDENLSLKLIELEDAESIFNITDTSREFLKDWLPWLNRIQEVNDTKNFIQGCLTGMIEKRSLHTVILFRGKVIGIASFNTINWSNKTAYVGYWIHKNYQGQGIVTKVVKTLINYAFKSLELNKVEIRMATGNQKSERIPIKLGFKKEGVIRQAEWLYDHYVDHNVYGLLKQE